MAQSSSKLSQISTSAIAQANDPQFSHLYLHHPTLKSFIYMISLEFFSQKAIKESYGNSLYLKIDL